MLSLVITFISFWSSLNAGDLCYAPALTCADNVIELKNGRCDDNVVDLPDEFTIEYDLRLITHTGVWDDDFIHIFDLGDTKLFVRFSDGDTDGSGKGLYLRYVDTAGNLAIIKPPNQNMQIGVKYSDVITITQSNVKWERDGQVMYDQPAQSHVTGNVGVPCFPKVGNAAATASDGKGFISNFKIKTVRPPKICLKYAESSSYILDHSPDNFTIANISYEWMIIFISVLGNIIFGYYYFCGSRSYDRKELKETIEYGSI